MAAARKLPRLLTVIFAAAGCAIAANDHSLTHHHHDRCQPGRYTSRYFTKFGHYGGVCIPCPAGKFSRGYNVSQILECEVCDTGKYQHHSGSASCIDCPFGKVQARTGGKVCAACPAGQYANRGQLKCTTQQFCPPGKFQNKVGAEQRCANCQPGRYSVQINRPYCTMCPSGKFAKSKGAAQCQACPAGQHQLWSGLPFCFAGKGIAGNPPTPRATIKPTLKPTPLTCKTGQFRNIAVLGKLRYILCSDCPGGKYGLAIGCKSCPMSKYQASQGAAHCNLCPRGKYQLVAGHAACIIGRTSCPKGTYFGQGTCMLCPAGRYQPGAGRLECYACHSGRYSDAGSASCEWKVGQTHLVGGSTAPPKSQSPSSSANSKPAAVSESKTTSAPAQQSIRNASPSIASQEQIAVNRIAELSSSIAALKKLDQEKHARAVNSMQAKPVSSPASVGSNSGSRTPASCQAGKYRCTDIHYQNICGKCPKGKYQPSSGRDQCLACGEGQFQDHPGQNYCQATKSLLQKEQQRRWLQAPAACIA